MVDTIDLLFPLDRSYSTSYLKNIDGANSDYSLDVEILLHNITIPIDSQEHINRFLDPNDNRRFIPSPKREDLNRISPGLSKLCFFRCYGNYYLNIVLRLEDLLENHKTNRLYVASDYNNYVLCYAFAKLMLRLFPCLGDNVCTIVHNLWKKEISLQRPYEPEIPLESFCLSRLPYLPFARVRRIDYSVNLKVPGELKAEILYMLKNSLRSKRNLKQRFFPNNNTYAKSKSVTLDIYDKALKIKTFPEAYAPYTSELLTESQNLIRYEVSIKKPKKDWALKHRKIDSVKRVYSLSTTDKDHDLQLLPLLLNEELAQNCLRDYYDLCLGQMPWVNKYTFDKTVDSSNFNRRTKRDMKDFAQLCSSFESVGKACKAVEDRVPVGRGSKRHTIGEQSASFNPQKFCDNNIKNIRSLGIQPLRLRTKSKLKELSCPFNLDNVVLTGYQFQLSDIELPIWLPFTSIDQSDIYTNIDTLFNVHLFKTTRFNDLADLKLYLRCGSHYRRDGELKKRYRDDFDGYDEDEDEEELTYEEASLKRLEASYNELASQLKYQLLYHGN